MGLGEAIASLSPELQFQSLGRDSVGWDARRTRTLPSGGPSFNPSVGILWGGTRGCFQAERLRSGFQSLGRDSVGWDPGSPRRRGLLDARFNPSVGILWGGTQG